MIQRVDITCVLSSRVLQYLSMGVVLLACKKPGAVETPTPVVIETVSEIDTEPEETTPVDSPDQTSSDEEDSPADIIFADNVNNAVALLTGDDQSVQMGLDALQNLDKNNEDSPEVPYNIGVAQLKLENERAAQKAFERAIEIDPTFAKAWFNLGVMLERNRQYQDAIAIYEEGLTHSEKDPSLSAGKIACLRKMGMLEEAVVYAQQVLGKNANNVAAYSEVGAVYLEQGKLDKALFVLQQAAARNGSENAKLQSILGQVYYAQEKLPQAERAFRKSLELDPTLIETAMYLSFLQLQNRAWSSASETLESALKLDPSNAALLNAHGVAKRGLGEIDEAERLYKESYQLNPSNPEPLLNLAVLEADYRNEYTKAFELLDRYIAEGGQNTDVVDSWRAEFQESEAAYLKEKKQQELRDLFRRRREEAAKKRAEEEAKRAAEEAQEPAEGVDDAVEDGVEESDEPEVETDSADEVDGADGDASETGDADPSGDDSVQEGDTETDGAEDNGWGSSEDSSSDQGAESGEAAEESDDGASNDAANNTEDTWGTPDTDSNSDTVEPTSPEGEGGMATDSDDSGADEADQAAQPDSGWGAPSEAQTCSQQSDCDDDKVCASRGECLFPDDFGTTLEGEECASNDQCAISLSCIENVCSQDEAASDDEE